MQFESRLASGSQSGRDSMINAPHHTHCLSYVTNLSHICGHVKSSSCKHGHRQTAVFGNVEFDRALLTNEYHV